MKKMIKVGDIVQSIAGRDAGENLLVINLSGDYAQVINGKSRKIAKPKKKKVKHLKKVLSRTLSGVMQNIQTGKPISNQKLHKMIKAQTQKIEED